MSRYSAWIILNGINFFTEEGKAPPATDRCVLADPLTYTWGFENEQVPGTLEPATVSVTLWARSTADLPTVDVGDLATVALWNGDVFGPSTALIVNGTHRVTAVDVDLVPTSLWAARMTVTAADLLIDLRATTLPALAWSDDWWNPGFPIINPDLDLAEYSFLLGLVAANTGFRLCAPESWRDPDGTYYAPDTSLIDPGPWAADCTTAAVRGATLAEALAALLPSYLTSAGPVTPAPYFGTHTPPGYWPGVTPALQGRENSLGVIPGRRRPPIPEGPTRFTLAPTGRVFSGAQPLPLQLAPSPDGITVDFNQEPGDMAGQLLAVDAGFCTLPARARRDRSHYANTAAVTAQDYKYKYGNDGYLLESTEVSAAVVEARSNTAAPTRSIEVATGRVRQTLTEGHAVPTSPIVNATAAEIAALGVAYLPDTSARTSWAFDELTISADYMTEAERAAILPRLTPAPPGTSRDGHLVRHITIHGIDPDSRLDAAPVLTGFVVSGSLTITGGSITAQVTLSPGIPATPEADAVTVADLAATVAATATPADLHPGLRVSHMRLTRA